MERDKLIWELQGLAQQEYALKNKNNVKPMVDELKNLQESIKRGEEDLQSLLEGIAFDEKKALELEKQVNIIAKQVKSGKEKLYGTKGSSLKELLSMQQSVLKMDEEIEKSEALYLETLNGIEARKDRHRQTKDIVRSLKKDYNEKLKVYRERVGQIELELAAIRIKQEELKERLEPAALRIYEDTLRRFPMNPVSLMKDGSCSGCNIEVPMVLARHIKEGKILYRCDSCGRLLITGV